MTKRANPYTEEFVPQSKVHVGFKQYNNNNNARLENVYEKTLALLYEGSRKTANQMVNLNTASKIICEKKDKMKQLCISKDGSLSNSGTVLQKYFALTQCTCGGPQPEAQCGYCEVALCSSCGHKCVHCHQTYCSRCSIIGSDSNSDICVSCYP